MVTYENLSTAPEDVMYPVSKKLGHKNLLSQEAYSDASKSLTQESSERRLKLQSELMEKDRQLNIIKKHAKLNSK